MRYNYNKYHVFDLIYSKFHLKQNSCICLDFMYNASVYTQPMAAYDRCYTCFQHVHAMHAQHL